MTRIKQLLAAALILALPGLGRSVTVPDGKAAVLEAVIGKVSVTADGKDLTAKVGQPLGFGDSIATGANGRVSIRHADNAVSRLAPNSELTLRAPGEKKGIFLALKTGFIRFLVGKRAPGESFEVSTPNAVAAVKGTDASVGTDGKSTDSAVYDSDHQEALSLLDLVSGKSVLLSPGEAVGLTSEGFERRSLNKDDFKKADSGFNGLPKPNVDAENGGAGDEETKAKAELGIDLAEAISDAFKDVMDDMGTDNVIEHDERTGDIAAGRVAFDSNGTRTQISSFVLHPSDKPETLLKATYSKRETGPYKGVSYAQEETTYNKALPEYWPTVVKRSLTDPENLAPYDPLDVNSPLYPIYWKVSQYFVAGNPQGDLMEVLRDYEVPTFYATYIGQDAYYNYLYDASGGLNSEQGYSQGLYMNGVPVFYFDYLTNKSDFDYYSSLDPSTLGYYDLSTTNLPISFGPNSYDYWNVYANGQYGEGPGGVVTGQAVITEGGGEILIGMNYDYYDCCSEDPFLSVNMKVLDQGGKPQDLDSGVAPNLWYDYLPRDFKGVDSAFNVEMNFSSRYLSAPIDLLVVPTVFDMMDFFDLPYSSGGGD